MKNWFKVFIELILGFYIIITTVIVTDRMMEILEKPDGGMTLVYYLLGVLLGIGFITHCGYRAYKILSPPDSTLNDTDNDGVHPPQRPDSHSEEHHPLNDHKATTLKETEVKHD